jgi:hypothetical protein
VGALHVLAGYHTPGACPFDLLKINAQLCGEVSHDRRNTKGPGRRSAHRHFPMPAGFPLVRILSGWHTAHIDNNRFAGLADVSQNLAGPRDRAGKHAALQQNAFRSRFQLRHRFVGFDIRKDVAPLYKVALLDLPGKDFALLNIGPHGGKSNRDGHW